MSRIKIRVSAGIFEVSLVRVIEESNSVEVLWDRGIKREFKWGSVVFGNLEGQTIGHKPSEAAPETERTCFFFPQMSASWPEPRLCHQKLLGHHSSYLNQLLLPLQGQPPSQRRLIYPTHPVWERTHMRLVVGDITTQRFRMQRRHPL